MQYTSTARFRLSFSLRILRLSLPYSPAPGPNSFSILDCSASSAAQLYPLSFSRSKFPYQAHFFHISSRGARDSHLFVFIFLYFFLLSTKRIVPAPKFIVRRGASARGELGGTNASQDPKKKWTNERWRWRCDGWRGGGSRKSRECKKYKAREIRVYRLWPIAAFGRRRHTIARLPSRRRRRGSSRFPVART